MTQAAILPAIWLIILVVGLPQLSETVYTPSLPDIAHALHVSDSTVEFTLTIYLFGFAVGTLLWGKISDTYGRKPCVIGGTAIFILACIGCYLSPTIQMLMFSRFIQAVGGSSGSVLGQAICRDAFHGPALGKVYSSVSSSLALFPAIGPLVGGVIAEHFGWPSIFIFLMCFAAILMILIHINLPETHHQSKRIPTPLLETALSLLRNKKVMGFNLIVATCNGISFSYFAEAAFYFMKGLGLSPSEYGFTFIGIALATMVGGMVSKKLHAFVPSKVIMEYGINVIITSAALFCLILVIHHTAVPLPAFLIIIATLLCQMGIMFGSCMAASNAMALALVDYKHAIGTASSLFGFFYYCLIALFTLGMGALHNGTLLVMPAYFLALSLLMLLVKSKMLHN